MILVFSFAVLLTNTSWGQNIFSNQQSLEFRPKAGFLIAHHENMAHLVKSHMYSGEIAYVFNTIGQRYWQKKYKYPSYGLSLYYLYTGNQKVLGNALGTFAFVKLPFINREHIQFNIKIGAGLGYLTKHFDQYKNPKNVAIGTHINALINFSFDLIYKWNKGYIGFGVDFTHLSNGGTILPNLGLNMPSLSIIYGIVTKKASLLDPAVKEVNKNWSFQGTGIFSLHQTRPGGGRVHPVYGIAAYMNKRFNEKTGMFLGFDFLYDDALNHSPSSKAPFNWKVVQTGFLVAYELNIDRLKMYLGMGIYLKNDLNPNGLFYHKLGFKYEFSKHFFGNIAVKTHWAQASYVEVGIGYKIFVSK
jgi:hypothetical protein